MACRPQPYRLDPPVNPENIAQIVTNADEMFQILFEDVAALCDQLEANETAVASVAVTAETAAAASAASTPCIFGQDGDDGLSIVGPRGLQGEQGLPGIPGIEGEDSPLAWFSPPPPNDPFAAIYGRVEGQTAAVATVVTYLIGVADASFVVVANVLVTVSTNHNFSVVINYTDEGNTARTATVNFTTVAGGIAVISDITQARGTVPYAGLATSLRCKAATTITVSTTGTFTNVTYNVEAFLDQVN